MQNGPKSVLKPHLQQYQLKFVISAERRVVLKGPFVIDSGSTYRFDRRVSRKCVRSGQCECIRSMMPCKEEEFYGGLEPL